MNAKNECDNNSKADKNHHHKVYLCSFLVSEDNVNEFLSPSASNKLKNFQAHAERKKE